MGVMSLKPQLGKDEHMGWCKLASVHEYAQTVPPALSPKPGLHMSLLRLKSLEILVQGTLPHTHGLTHKTNILFSTSQVPLQKVLPKPLMFC